MVLATLVLLVVAANMCSGGTQLQYRDDDHSMASAVAAVIEEVLATVSQSISSIFLFTDGNIPASSLYTLTDRLRTSGGVGVFEGAVDGPDANRTERQLSWLTDGVNQLRRVSWYVMVVVLSDDPAFLASFAQWSLKGRLLVWSTRLLVVTRLPLPELHHLHKTLSMSNSMLLIMNNDKMIYSCSVYLHLPYSPRGAQALRVASWTLHRGLNLTSHLPLFPDKFDKFPQRPTLKATTEVNPFTRMITLEDPEAPGGRRYKFWGPVPELMDYLATSTNFSYQFLRPEDGTWGVRLKNGSWTGMMGMLLRGEVTIGAGPFIVSGARAEVVDYTVSILTDYWRILGARGLPEVDPWGFLLPLEPLVWTSILSALLILSTLVFLISLSCFQKKGDQGSWLQVIFDYTRILLQQDVLEPMTWWWQRVVLAVWMLMTLVLTRSYAGTLMSLLAVRHISEPYQSLQDLLDDPSVTMIWEKGSAAQRYLHSVESGIYREIANTEKEGRLIYRTHSQFPETIDTLVRQGDHVLMEVDMGVLAYIGRDFTRTGQCSFYESRERFLPLMFGLIGPKASPIIPALNKRIMAMTEAGLFFYWMKVAEPNITVCIGSPTKVTVKTTLSLSNVWGMFTILVAGHVIGLCVLCLEFLSLRLRRMNIGF